MSDSLHITFKEIIELCSDSEDSTVEIDSDDENDEEEEDDVVIVYDGPPLATSSQKKSEEEEKEEHQQEDEEKKKKKLEAQPVVRRDLSPEEVAKCPPYITRSFVRGVEELASGNVQPSNDNVRRRQSDRLKNKQQAAVKEYQKKASSEKRPKNQSKAVAKKPRKTDAEQSSTLTCPKCHDSYPTVKDLCDHYAVHVFKTDSSVQQQQQHQQQPAPVPPPPSFDVFNFTEAIPQPERRYFCPQCPELNGFEQAIELEVHNELIHASPDDYLNLPPGTSSSTTSIAINRALLTAPSLNQPVTRPFEDATTVTEWSSSLLDDTNFPFGPPPPVFQPLIDPDWPCPPFDSLFNTSDSIFRI